MIIDAADCQRSARATMTAPLRILREADARPRQPVGVRTGSQMGNDDDVGGSQFFPRDPGASRLSPASPRPLRPDALGRSSSCCRAAGVRLAQMPQREPSVEGSLCVRKVVGVCGGACQRISGCEPQSPWLAPPDFVTWKRPLPSAFTV